MTNGVRQTSLLCFSRLLLLIVVIFLKDLKRIWWWGGDNFQDKQVCQINLAASRIQFDGTVVASSGLAGFPKKIFPLFYDEKGEKV